MPAGLAVRQERHEAQEAVTFGSLLRSVPYPAGFIRSGTSSFYQSETRAFLLPALARAIFLTCFF